MLWGITCKIIWIKIQSVPVPEGTQSILITRQISFLISSNSSNRVNLSKQSQYSQCIDNPFHSLGDHMAFLGWLQLKMIASMLCSKIKTRFAQNSTVTYGNEWMKEN